MKPCDGRDQPSIAFLPKLGPLELKRPFLHPRLPAAAPSCVSAPCTALLPPSLHQVDREWKHDGRAAFARDVEQGCEIAQLHGLRHRRQDLRGLEQLLCRLLRSEEHTSKLQSRENL